MGGESRDEITIIMIIKKNIYKDTCHHVAATRGVTITSLFATFAPRPFL